MLSNASIYLGANVLNATIPFLLLPILTRVLAPVQYGTVAVFEAAIACLSVFTGLSTHGAIGVRYYREDRGTFPEYVGVCVLILLVSTAVAAVVLVAAGGFLQRATGLSVSWLLIAALVSLAQFLVNIRLVIWQSKGEALRYGAFQIAQTALNAVLSLVLVLYLAWQAAGRMAGLAVAVITAGAVAFASMQARGWIRWRWNREHLRDALAFGMPLIPHTLGTFAVTFADRFIITQQLGADATGLYFAAAQLSMPLLMLGSAFNRAFVPWLFARLSSGENSAAVLVSYAAVAGMVLSGALYGLLVYLALPFAIGEQYQRAGSLALVLIVGTTCQAAYYAVVNYIFYAKKTGYLALITFAMGAIYIAGAYLVSARYGLKAMAILFAAVQCSTFLLVWLVAARVSPQPWFKFSALRIAGRSVLK
jgi:O-antigen/teichoic acid export membrane protein